MAHILRLVLKVTFDALPKQIWTCDFGHCPFVDNISLQITSLRQNLTMADVLVAVHSCILHPIYTVHILTVPGAKSATNISAAVQRYYCVR